MGLPVVTNPAPVAGWVDPTLDENNQPIPDGEVTGYQVGIRDLNAAGSAIGVYPNTAAVLGATSHAEPLALLYQQPNMMQPGHSYAAAGMTLAKSPPGNSKWGPEYQFIWQPLAPPVPPVLTVA